MSYLSSLPIHHTVGKKGAWEARLPFQAEVVGWEKGIYEGAW